MKIVFLLGILLVGITYGQTTRNYWVQLTDKSSTPFSISLPEDYLSNKAIERRTAQGISIDTKDLPVDPAYVSQISSIAGVNIRHTSKWFNAVSISLNDSTVVDSILNLPFVVRVDTVKTLKINTDLELSSKSGGHTNYHHEYYGAGFKQIELHTGQFLHSLGYDGAGKTIAVLDAGFSGVGSLTVFAKMRNEGRLLATRDFVDGDNYVYHASQHGTAVLSCLAADLKGAMVGTAPGAAYILIRTEETGAESRVEEDNWVAGAEYADSMGADIINTSLGYTEFDDTTMNYTYADMDGNTARISVGADIAASRGMLVVTSAGNMGQQPWYYISAPADADSTLAVAAVDSFRVRAPFSSYGPSSDGDQKPNVAAMGFRATCAFPDGSIRSCNGTSFSSPILSGMAACLWQALPNLNNMQLKSLIEQHGHQATAPDYSLGYGVPNFYTAYLDGKNQIGSNQDELLHVFPSMFQDVLRVQFHAETTGDWQLRMIDELGQVVFDNTINVQSGEYVQSVFTDEITVLAAGTYVIQLVQDGILVDYYKVVKIKD